MLTMLNHWNGSLYWITIDTRAFCSFNFLNDFNKI